MVSDGKDADILAHNLVRRYTDELEKMQAEGNDLSLVEKALIVERENQTRLEELSFWIDQLKLRKTFP